MIALDSTPPSPPIKTFEIMAQPAEVALQVHSFSFPFYIPYYIIISINQQEVRNNNNNTKPKKYL